MYINGKKVSQFIKTDAVNVDESLSDTSENAVQNKVVTAELNKKVNKSDIDSELSETSENAVQNKVITEELNKKLSNDRVVLYTNENTTFSAQKISFDATPYKYFQLLFKVVGGESKIFSKFFPKDYSLQSGVIYMNWDTIFKREFTLSATGITFTEGYQITEYGSSGPVTNNKVMIPFYIYGVK